MNTTAAPNHRLHIPGLAEAVAASPVTNPHSALLQRVQRIPGLATARLAHILDEGGRLQRRKVLDLEGALVHADHAAWLEAQLDADQGDAAATRRRLHAEGYLLTVCNTQTVYLVIDRLGLNQADFIQLEITVEDEFHDQPLFEYESSWRTFTGLRDLLLDCDGDALHGGARQRFRPTAYRLDKATDVAAFVDAAVAADRLKYPLPSEAVRAVLYYKANKLPSLDSTPLAPTPRPPTSKPSALSELFKWPSCLSKTRRFFDDWAASSAGASGARLCEHWVMKMTDYTSAQGVRSLELIPSWTTRHKLAEVDASKADCYTFFGKLQTLDRRVKVPFGWYFFMLHGNRVTSEAGERVLREAEAGLIVLPECDYRVLKRWQTEPYGL